MDIKITLISPPSFCVEDAHLEQHLGLAYISSYLQEHKFNVKIIELTGMKHKSLNEIVIDIPYSDVFGISCYSTNYNSVKLLVKHIRNNYPNAYICLGGPHPTSMPEETINELQVDSVICGEGEVAFLSMVTKISNGIRPTGIFKEQEINNLDKLPFPNRDHVKKNNYTRLFHGNKTISLISSRGCKHKCLHCNSVIMGGGAKSTRFRKTKNIIEEIRYLKTLGYKHFRFNDDNFADNPDLFELLDSIENEFIRYRIFSRIDNLDRDTLIKIYKSGCDFIDIGIESLNENNLHFLKKSNILKHLKNLETAKQLGITIRSSFMVGLPFDTDESIKNDFEKAARLPFDEYAIYPLLPYPGTAIWKEPKKYGYEIIEPDFTKYVQLGVNKFTSFTMRHTNEKTGYTFYPDDVKRWLALASSILSKTKIHIKDSTIAR